jgi:hypothetical protein
LKPMTPGTAQYSNDSESLQADVMRFMAIIAFCLIAILALVRNVEPGDITPTRAPEPVAEPEPEPAPEPTEPLELVIEPEPIPEPAIEPEPPEPFIAEEMPPPEPLPPPVAPEPTVETIVPEPRPVWKAIAPVPEPTPAPAPATEPSEEDGLILRFASDGDFLRLIARGDIKVYAYQDSDVLGLDGSYRFLESRAPGQVYELLSASIPSLIVDALRRERTDIQAYRWGIALPSRISSQIERYLESVEHGQLVIDRFGDVHHVAAS